MHDVDRDDALLREAFGKFRAAARPHLRPAGIGGVRATVRRRRRRGRVALAGAALLLASVSFISIQRSNSDAPDGDEQHGQGASGCPGSGTAGLDLATEATDIVLGPLGAGTKRNWRAGQMTVRVCNAGDAAAPAGRFKLRWLATVPGAGTMGQGSWRGCASADHETEAVAGEEVVYYVAHCEYPSLPPGGSREYTLDFNTLGDADAGIDRPAVHFAEVAAGDANPGNDRATFHIRIG